MADAGDRDPSAVRVAAAWATRIVLAAAALSLCELAFVVPTLPAAISVGSGFAALAADIAFVYALVAVPFALAGALIERRVQIRLPEPAAVLALLVGAVAAVQLIDVIDWYIYPPLTEFVERTETLHKLAVATMLCGVWAASRFVVYPLFRRLVTASPNLGRPTVISGFALWVAAGAFVALAHALQAIYNDNLAALAACMATGCAIGAARIAVVDPGARLRTAAAIALGGLCVVAGVGSSPHARFVLHSNAAGAGNLARVMQDALDFDGDGSPARWLGGDDCAPFDRARGPGARDIPADGIDQDCSGADAPAPPPAPPPARWAACAAAPAEMSVLLITIDALRYDALSPELTPGLVAFARAGRLYTRAYAPGTDTLLTMHSVMSGHAVTDVRVDPARRAGFHVDQTLAERMAAAKLATVELNRFELGPIIPRGFQGLNPIPGDTPMAGKRDVQSAYLTDSAEHAVEQLAKRRFFVWVHYPDTHAPYKSAEGDERARYEWGAQYVDQAVGRLLAFVAHGGYLAHTLVIITADHGEELGQRGREGHGASVFEETIHVPLFVWVPGCAPGQVDEPVSLLQLAPAIGALTGVPVPGAPLPPGTPTRSVPVVSEANMEDNFRRAVIVGRYKLMHDVRFGGRMLFDLEQDPGETRDIYEAAPEARRQVEAAYQLWLDAVGHR